VHRSQGGATEPDNLVSLCHLHHRRLHDGAYLIRPHPDVGVIFERPDGQPILRRPPGVDPEVPRDAALRAAISAGDELCIDATTAGATDAGAPMDLGYVVSAVLDHAARARPLPVPG
jgi:hypothetical protein